MYICGIIAEYDPFHTGHAHQIQNTKNMLGDDCAIICVMSGNWTQRGSPAIIDKSHRARMALEGGADLVLELPLPYAVSSAEWFARGGVSVLNATGVVTHLCFGSECGQLEPLEKTAQCLDSDEYICQLRMFLDQGLSFPSARQKAVAELIGDVSDCLSLPNNNLGVEYLRALNWCGSSITPITIHREGAGHGESPSGGFASASYIRQLLRDGKFEEAGYYSPSMQQKELYTHLISNPCAAERAMLFRLRQMSVEELAAIPDCGEGLSYRLYQAIHENSSIENILACAKSKRYTLSRLRRILLWAFLGLTAADRPDTPPYLRVLAMNPTGRLILRQIKEQSSTPILTKPSHVKQMSASAQALFELESNATDCYGLFLPHVPPCGTEWLRSPEILEPLK